MRTRMFVVAVVGGLLTGACATSHQSARVLAPGKTQVTAALGRTSAIDEGLDEGAWAGDLQIHAGVADRFEVGGRLVRLPGQETGSYAAIDARFQVVPEHVSVGLPIGILWSEEDGDFSEGFKMLAPTVYAGADLTPTIELVAAPKLFVFIPQDDDDNTEVEFGGSVGVRFTNLERTWAIHPEIGFVQFSEGDDDQWITFGLGVAVGN